MPKRPEARLSSRPLHFFWICDCSGSMSLDGKIQALNNAIREALPELNKISEENPYANILMKVLRFSHGSEWQLPMETPLSDFHWTDLTADPLQRPELDIIFMIDTSGSMGDEIEGVKRSCFAFASEIIEQGAEVRLGLVGFDIGGHRGLSNSLYTVHNLSQYTIGIWPLTEPKAFQHNIQSLSLGLFGGGGCYIANPDTIDMFPHVIKTFNGPSTSAKILVIISDEIGNAEGVQQITQQLNASRITTHFLGVSGGSRAHQDIAKATGGQFWDITRTHGVQDFSSLLGTVAETIAKEMTRNMGDGTVSAGTDMGSAMIKLSEQLQIPPMTDRALPPVLLLISDGQPTDDFEQGLQQLMSQPWGKKAVRLAIAIGSDADPTVLQKFIGNSEIKPLQAHNPEALSRFIKLCSTSALRVASAPVAGSANPVELLAREIPQPTLNSATDVW